MTLNNRERRALETAIQTAARYQRAFGQLSKGALTARDVQVLLVLARDGASGASDVARRLDRDRASVTRALERLRGQGLVRHAQPEGRRKPQGLTAAGEQAARAFLAELA